MPVNLSANESLKRIHARARVPATGIRSVQELKGGAPIDRHLSIPRPFAKRRARRRSHSFRCGGVVTTRVDVNERPRGRMRETRPSRCKRRRTEANRRVRGRTPVWFAIKLVYDFSNRPFSD